MKFHTLPVVKYYAGTMAFILLVLWPVGLFIWGWQEYQVTGDVRWFVLPGVLLLLCILLHQFSFWKKFYATLHISENEIVWKCPLRKSISISIEDCVQIGIEFEKTPAPLVYPYIYFVTYPYSKDTSKNYGKVKCRDGLIKFRYSNRIAKYVISKHNTKTSFALCDFYRKHKDHKVFY